MSRSIRRVRSAAALVAVGALALGVGAAAWTPREAVAAQEAPGLVTTDSTRSVAWAPRTDLDGPEAADPSAFEALDDWRLRVSQTEDLLNQTVEVSWAGAAAGGVVQLMQCWSDGPEVPPTREQCGWGGIDADAASPTAATRTRQLGADPRETTYRTPGSLRVITVDGTLPGASWSGSSTVTVAATNNFPGCPAATTGYSVVLTPPRLTGAAAEGLPASAVVVGPVATPPAPLTRTEGPFEVTYPSVADGFTFDAAAAAAGLESWPVGVYRLQMDCTTGALGTEVLGSFVQYVQQTEAEGGARSWAPFFRSGGVFVPFDPLGDTTQLGPTDPYYGEDVLEYLRPRTSNDVWQAATRPDGSGTAYVEVFTDLQAQHLGCGRADADGPRSCWLVAVPRFAGEPNGQPFNASVGYSPLSQTLWDRRIEVPLGFLPVDAGCAIGSGLKQILSNDMALSALRSWQPRFCAETSTASSVVGPLQDFNVRAGVSRPNRMGVVGTPPEGVRTAVVAPVATSGVVVAFTVDRQEPFGGADYGLNGTRTTELNLNARLLAKLLTQSYDAGAAPNGGRTGPGQTELTDGFQFTFTPGRRFPAGNPVNLFQDPEFQRLNPQYTWAFDETPLGDVTLVSEVLVSVADTDAYGVVWQWIAGDPAASSFLAGQPDEDGMTINPYYQAQVSAASSSFQLLDPTCVDFLPGAELDRFPLLCQLNNHPRVEDDTEAAVSAVRGDTRKVNVVPPEVGALAATYIAAGRQDQGRQAMLVVTSSPVAERYGLPTARLQNSAGEFVAATGDSMAVARSAMGTRVDGVLTPVPASVPAGGYPLTSNAYAVVDVAETTQDQNDAFADILDYAAGDGQVIGNAQGQLPPGYAPLSDALREQTQAAADLLRDPSALLTEPASDVPVAAPAALPSPVSTPAPASPTAQATPGAEAPTPSAAAPPAAAPPAAAAAVPETELAANSTRTPNSSAALPWLLPGLLLVGVATAVAGPVLSLVGRRSSP